jgi:hypothetical protein
VGIRAEAAVAQQHIAGGQLRVGGRQLARLVGPQRGGGDPQEHPGREIEDRQELGQGEAAPRALGRGLAEVAPQLGDVGHREAGPVDDPDPMTAPAAGRLGGASQARRGGLQEALPKRQGQPLAGLAVGAGGEGPAAEMDDVLAGGIAVEDLEQEQVDGGDRIEDAVAPAMADGLAGVGDGLGAEAGGEVLPEACEDGSESGGHGGGSVGCAVSCPTPSCRGPSPCSTRHKSADQQAFGVAFMPFPTGSIATHAPSPGCHFQHGSPA